MATQIDVDSEGNEYPLSLASDTEADQIIEIINGGITKLNQVNGEVVPGYFSDKLDKVISTKAGIKSAIEYEGVEFPPDAPFSAYPGLISQIANVVEAPIAESLDEINGEVIQPDIAAKLGTVSETKSAIKAAIEAKGVAVPEGLVFSGYSGLISDITGTGIEVWNVYNEAMVNPGTGLGGIRWNDPVQAEFDHIGIFEDDEEVAEIAPGVQRFEPEEGTHQYTIKVVFENGQTSAGYQLSETAYFYSYSAILQSAVIAITEPNKLTLTFDNFVNITDAAGISIAGISDSITLVDQPDVRTIRLQIDTAMFLNGVPYTVSYDASTGNIELSNGTPLPSFNSFGVTNYSTYGLTTFISAQVPVAEPSTLVLAMSRAVTVSDISAFTLSGTTAQITGKVSDGETVEFTLSEPVDSSEVESAVKLSFNGTGMIDSFGQAVPAFENQAVTNNSTNHAVTVQAAEVTSGNSKQLKLVMTGVVSMTDSSGLSVTGEQDFDLSGCAYSISDGTITFTLPSDIFSGKTISVVYDGTGTLKASNGDTIHAFSQPITNNSSTVQGFGPGSSARDLAVALLGRACQSAAEVTQVFNMVSLTITNGLVGNFVEGDYIDLVSLTVASGYASGGAITLTISDIVDGAPMTRFYIVTKNHMKGKNGNTQDNVAFHSRHCLGYDGVSGTDGHYMNSTNTNSGGYAECQMRQYLTNNMQAALEAAGVPLAAHGYAPARRVSKGGSAASPGYDTIQDKVFLPTEWEMFGTRTYSNANAEDETYQGRFSLYQDNAGRIKKTKDGTARIYWLASPYSGGTGAFVRVAADGSTSYYNANLVRGLAPAFCVA
jgi:hypothetical protein